MPPPPKIPGKNFLGSYHVKFGHFLGTCRVKFGNFVNFSGKYHVTHKIRVFVNFACIISAKNVLLPPKLTELLRLWLA